MPQFAYEGRTPAGDARRGEITAASLDAARARLRQMQIDPTTLRRKSLWSAELHLPRIGFLKPRVTNKDLVIFTRQFATMIDSGLPLVQCLEIQAQQAPNPTLREEIRVVKEAVESGSTFADALHKFPRTFDDLYQNLVAAGEMGGILDTILNRLAIQLEKTEKLRRQIRGAMTYPAIVFTVGIGVVALLLLEVVPTFESMFAEFERTLPVPTQWTIALSQWLQRYFYVVLLALLGTGVLLRTLYQQRSGRLVVDRLLLRTPAVGDLLRKTAVARFCRTLGTMISSGVPILDALDICGKTAGNLVIENAIARARDSIAEGRSIAEPLLATRVFPEMVCQMISVGEATGALDVMLGKVADFYEDEVDHAVDTLTSVMQPVIIVCLAIFVGGFAISMYLPIFTMASGIQQ
ncbi:MAG: type II secretion system F family protein [Deltaproteobacteria bacterium]|nr:type II secretion system F family protein [Deltaproteobacteria bacterium]